MPYFSYMFRCISHHLQGELGTFLIRNHLLLQTYCVWYIGCVKTYKRYNFVGLQYFYSGYSNICCMLFCILTVLLHEIATVSFYSPWGHFPPKSRSKINLLHGVETRQTITFQTSNLLVQQIALCSRWFVILPYELPCTALQLSVIRFSDEACIVCSQRLQFKIHVIANTIIHSLHTLELKQSAGYRFGVTMMMAMVLVFTPSLPFTFITSCNVQMTETNQASRIRHNWPLFLTPRSCSCLISYRDAVDAESAKSVTQEECAVRKLAVE